MDKKEQIKEIVALQQQADQILGQFSPEPWIELNLTLAQLKSLFFIAAKEKTNFKRLAEALGVTPPNVTGIIDRLVEQGLVTRTENPEDRRIMLLQITDKGRELINNLRENRARPMTKILDNMSPEELVQQNQSLHVMIRAAEAYKNKIAK